jgi:hypothetical protein
LKPVNEKFPAVRKILVDYMIYRTENIFYKKDEFKAHDINHDPKIPKYIH